MSRIADCFASLRAQQKTALIPFVTAGDPQPEVTVPLLHTLVAQGADILELGVPFSDPMADGPVIQLASERALAQGVSLTQVLAVVAEFRRTNTTTPIVLMGYLNPLEAMGYASFAAAAQQAGVDGVLMVDSPPEACRDLTDCLMQQAIDPIFLLAPTTTSQRIAQITQAARGFVYYVSLKGVTGAGHLDTANVAAKLQEIRQHTNLPVGVGFGIKDAATAQAVAAIADAVVIGSALVARMADYADQPDQIPVVAGALLAELRAAIDSA
ncbi:MAG: tryptophan synthase subunit alpha [Pseudomonadota bacterium]